MWDPETDRQGFSESSWDGKRCFVLGNTWGELCRGYRPVFHCIADCWDKSPWQLGAMPVLQNMPRRAQCSTETGLWGCVLMTTVSVNKKGKRSGVKINSCNLWIFAIATTLLYILVFTLSGAYEVFECIINFLKTFKCIIILNIKWWAHTDNVKKHGK